MKFTFDRDAMIKEISIAQEIITNKSPISILSNILLIAENNQLVIKATDSKVKFTTTIPVDIQEEGRTTIYCDKFMSILSSLPTGEVEFLQEDIGVVIKPFSKKVKFQLKSQASDKFPEIGTSENISFFEFPAKDFKELIKHTVFAVSDDPNRYFMAGVYFEKKDDKLVAVATDGRRLSCIKKDGLNVPDFNPSIVPVKILNCVAKHAPDEGNISISFVDKSLFVKFLNLEFSTAFVDGQFPKYDRVIPDNLNAKFQVNKADLDAALKRTAIMVEKKVNKIIFKISSGVLKLISPESEIGTADEEIPCRYDGQNISMAFNYNYVTDPIRVIDSENLVFEFKIGDNQIGDEANIITAVILHGESAGDYLHVIMPMTY